MVGPGGRRRPFVLAGYSLSAVSKPVMGVAAWVLGWPLFFAGRCGDRLGKSVRTAARDALIADSTEPAYRGVAFGFHRALDTCGAVLGPLTALAILALWPAAPLAWLFIVALVPGALSVLLVVFGVHDIPHSPGGRSESRPQTGALPRFFWLLLAAFALFSLGNSSDSFLILRSRELGLSFAHVILVYTFFNVVYAACATPLGHLSDRIGRKPVPIAGWLTFAMVYLGFAGLRSATAPWLLFAIYGVYQALTEGVSKAFVSDLVAEHQRAGAIGLLAMAGGLGQLVASILAGALWHVRVMDDRLMLPFLLGAGGALAAVPLVLLVRARAPGAAH